MLVVLYSRPGCHLCDAARDALEAERELAGFELREVSIDGDPELERAYGVRIPVVEVDGREAFEFEVDPGELARLLRPAS